MTHDGPKTATSPRRRQLVREGRTVDEMVRVIADQIVTGAIHPGERLDEHSLAATFQVSRTPVRESLQKLAAMGMVERRPNRGAIAASVTQEMLSAMFESMAELEGICARLAAQRMTPLERRQLQNEHEASARLVHASDEDGYERYNTEFHNRLYSGAHNCHMEELALATRARLAPYRRAQFRLPERLSKSWNEHEMIVKAILRADDSAAGQFAIAHVATVRQATAQFLNRPDPKPDLG